MQQNTDTNATKIAAIAKAETKNLERTRNDIKKLSEKVAAKINEITTELSEKAIETTEISANTYTDVNEITVELSEKHVNVANVTTFILNASKLQNILKTLGNNVEVLETDYYDAIYTKQLLNCLFDCLTEISAKLNEKAVNSTAKTTETTETTETTDESFANICKRYIEHFKFQYPALIKLVNSKHVLPNCCKGG